MASSLFFPSELQDSAPATSPAQRLSFLLLRRPVRDVNRQSKITVFSSTSEGDTSFDRKIMQCD
jgi:hypothetical protein